MCIRDSHRTGDNKGAFTFKSRVSGSNYPELMRISAEDNGRIGIRNNLVTNFWDNANTLTIGDGGGSVGITFFTASAADGSHIAFQESTGNSPEGLISYYQGGYSTAADRDNMIFKTNGGERLRIGSTGRVGIAQANPQAKLDVSGAYNEIGIRCSGGASGYSSAFVFQHANGDTVLEGNNARHVIPGDDAVQDLGISTKRWRNVYTTDLQLSNVGGGGNEVDGTEGTWTLQEGEDDIYMINRKTGKKYKMMLQEVS